VRGWLMMWEIWLTGLALDGAWEKGKGFEGVLLNILEEGRKRRKRKK
jgi:hypothetical protein